MDSTETGRQEISSSAPEELIQADPSELRFPFLRNAVQIGMPMCNYVTVSELICSGCFSLVLYNYNHGAANIRCSRCNMVNSTRTASLIPHLTCGQCRTVLMYPAGAIIVGCATCQHLNPVQGQGSSAPPTESTLDNMSLQHLKDITNDFCDERILGRGGFGVVYKGVLGNGKMVAVKKLVQSMSSSQEQFENEVNLLMKLKHPNIVRLVGYCYETQHLRSHHEGKFVFAWSTECLLCLEFLPKGSLDKYISDASTGLDWPTRHKIIVGISYGPQYLHEQSDGPIIHLDLKPANILLEENMIPKIRLWSIKTA